MFARCVHTSSHAHRYAAKLQHKARQCGIDVDQLVAQAREQARRKQRQDGAALTASFRKEPPRTQESARAPTPRRDSSPVKPLSSILNLQKLVATPHTPSQISALWTAYHASRTNGTGRGYVSASLSLDSYNSMARVAKNFPVFVVPLPRQSSSDPPADESTRPAHEFFFLQWDFHPAPPVPSAADPNLFESATPGSSSHLPVLSTVLFTPLQEYKLRATFATPYLVLTFYTDLSQSHGIVLLRGEITPSSSSVTQPGKETLERFHLSQVDAQLLAMGLQRFYLWGTGGKEGADRDSTAETLLRQFHEEPETFNWQDLLKFSSTIA